MKTILVIAELNQEHQDQLTELAHADYRLLTADRAFLGIRYARHHCPHLILCSMTLPDSTTVLNALRNDPRTAIIPVIALAEKLVRSQLRQAMVLGASDYLVEPFSTAELRQAITTQLDKQAALEQWFTARSPGAEKVLEPDLDTLQPPGKAPLNDVFSYIESNYHRAITLGDVAKAVGYSPTYLTNLTRRHTGQTIQQWIIERRMVAARRLLLETDDIIEQIAAQVGYQHTVHFFRQFRQVHGTTPQSWRSVNRASS